MKAVIVFTTTPDLKSARRIAQNLVSQRLAACVSIYPKITSFYRWKGKIEKSSESFLMIKTVKSNFSSVEKTLRKIHPYEVPEILSVPVAGISRDYLAWLEGGVLTNKTKKIK